MDASSRENLYELLDASQSAAGMAWRQRVWLRVRHAALVSLAIFGIGSAWTVAHDRWISPYRPPADLSTAPPVDDPLLAEARMADPVEDDVRWGMRAFLDDKQRRCVLLGQVIAGRTGRAASGKFMPFGLRPAPYCKVRDQQAMVVMRKFAVAPDGLRTVVFGLAGRDVRTLSIGRRPPGQTLRVAGDGTFVYVTLGVDTLDGFNTYITDAAGTRTEQLSAR